MYEAIVVGARVAGSPLAMLLARKGYRVLLVDKGTFPSDIISTHHIHQPGVARLKRWGLLERVHASNAPPTYKMTLDVGPFALSGRVPPYEGVGAAYSVRRRVLDKILADAAVEAGAELREDFTVEELTFEGGRVTGIRGRQGRGPVVTEKARVVVGADGPRSFVARAAGAPVYHDRGLFTCCYYSYWSGVEADGPELYPRDRRLFVVDPTNDGLAMVGAIFPVSEFDAVRADVEGSFLRAIDEHAPALGARLRRGRREERFFGTGYLPNFFRRPYGAGWALVGDAGYVKDPVCAQGITNGFSHAELLADALDEGFSGWRTLGETLADYERRRNEEVLPMYEHNCQLASLEPPPAEMQQLFAALRGNQPDTDRFMGIVPGTTPLHEFFAPDNVRRILGLAALRPAA